MKSLKYFSKVILVFATFFNPVVSLKAQQDLNIKDVSGFQDSRHHWKDITDHEQVIVPLKDQRAIILRR